MVCFTDGYRLISGRSQDRNLSLVIFQFGRFTETIRHSSRDEKRSTTTFTGMAQQEAHSAHNREVTGSKPVAGILHFVGFKETDGHSSRDLQT